MCKHILNSQVSIRAPCCKQWFDCAECHAETQDHQLTKTTEMAFACKRCKKVFRKDMSNYEESDEYCPHCDNHYVIEAKTPQAVVGVEGEDARVDARQTASLLYCLIVSAMAIHPVYPRDNDALDTNPPAGDAHITTHASDWLWAVFAIMLVSWLIILGWTYSTRKTRVFHYIPLIVLSVATVAYFSMASDLGWTLIRSEFDSHPTRQIWYVRYIQWFINAPLLLFAMLSFTQAATAQILTILFFSWFLVVNGLIGALVTSSYKWAYFVFGLFGLFFIWVQMLGVIPWQSNQLPHWTFKPGFLIGAAYISFMWMLYPICWGLSEGSNTISPTSEMVFYGILDILSGPVFLFGFIAYVMPFGPQQLQDTAFGGTNRGEEGVPVVQQQKAPAANAGGNARAAGADAPPAAPTSGQPALQSA
ncbi:hypothetical protein JVT61DRAFT_787 [Boletus reticuloceps]|uniref:CHY-type domain-containing protein n=1 Tax=Boletus reticuloceps TaxID=495285 RepID=A0A8I3AFZ2_9AGAM|nr:hypothetical protein JVT61DRAFT_787 [Boletus reticuloceps]